MYRIEVAYAERENVVHVINIEVAPGTTVRQAIEASGLMQACRDIDLARNSVGIFSTVCPLDTAVSDGDRVEIYRPLTADPKEARRRRAKIRQHGY